MKIVKKLILSLFLFIALSELRGQVANDNPTGAAGMFNGNVTTAGSYDPYTGNTTRSITDIVVAGAVGQYGLSYSRTWNSRTPGWRSSLSWSINSITAVPGDAISYTVNFPDGRVETFSYSSSDVYFRSLPGVQERLQPWNGSYCYLILPDGGKVEFHGVKTLYSDPELIPSTWYDLDFTVTAVIDPYGLRTTFTTEADGSRKITEPGGLWLKLRPRVSGVEVLEASDGRSVDYTYTTQAFGTVPYSLLTSIVYYDNLSVKATYTYQAPNVGSINGIPLLSTCDDPMYEGPMKRISYVYATGNNPDDTPAVYGQISAERNPADNVAVSTLTVNTVGTRTETRGDGPTRTFTYLSTLLTGWTDFKGASTSRTYSNGFPISETDANGKTTNFVNDPKTGNVTLVTYPLTPPDTTRATVQYVYGSASCPDPNNRDGNNPYYLYSVTNELGKTTIFLRDANKRVTRINHPDGGYETFTYNSFGQVLTHRRTNGAYDHFAYDAARRLWKRWNPTFTATYPPPAGEPYTSFAYYSTAPSIGRVQTAVDAGGNSTGFQYNARGQITRVTHPGGAYLQAGHNPDGTLAWTADENHPGAATDPSQRTRFAYDGYKRVVSVTDPLGNPFTASYVPWNKTSSSLTTSNFVFIATAPSQEKVYRYWDNNMRLEHMTQAPGTPLAASTYFTYDPVGNRLTVKNPRNYTTSYAYDERNRLETMTNPLTQITRWAYDKAGNVLTVTNPDNTTQVKTYDALNRVLTDKDPMNRITTFTYNPSGTAATIKDPNLHTTTFSYDAADAKTRMSYQNGDYQDYAYDANHNLISRRAASGKYQHFIYDNRNRMTTMSWRATSDPASAEIVWANGVTDKSTFLYDAASQLTSAQNQFSTVTRAYDAAGDLTWENQNLGATVNKKVQYEYDAGGKRTRLYVTNDTNGYDRDFTYDAMGRFEKILNHSDGALWFQYSYDAASNETQRFNAFNSVAQIYTRDPLNRISRRDIKRLTTTISYEAYGFDAMSRVLTIDREDGKRDLFGYNPAGELTSAKYGLVNGINPTRSVSYALDEAGNRESVTDGGTTNYTTDTINRYTLVGASSVVAGPSHQIGAFQANSYQYVGDSYLASVTAGSATYTLGYDALGRCVRRTSNGVPTYYIYDGARPIMEYKSTGALAGSNLYGKGIDEVLMRADYVVIPGGQGYFYQQNHVGSVTHLTGWAGEVIEKYSYDAFGQPTTTYTGGVFNNRFKFTGREHQPTFGIYEYRNRAYHPGLGRFLSEDPIGFSAGDTNLFRYCGGDPVNWIDPFGLKEKKYNNEAMGGGYEITLEPVIVSAPEIPVYDGKRDIGVLDRTGGATGEGSARDGGREAGTLYAKNVRPGRPHRPLKGSPLKDKKRPFQEGPDVDREKMNRSVNTYVYALRQLYYDIQTILNFFLPSPTPGSTPVFSPITPLPPSGPSGFPSPSPSGPPAPGGG